MAVVVTGVGRLRRPGRLVASLAAAATRSSAIDRARRVPDGPGRDAR